MPSRVLIVGAGPVGLVTALRLAGVGIGSTILEQSRDVPHDLRASTFHPPTLDMLDELDVADEFISLGVVTPDWQVLHLETGQRAVFEIAVIGDCVRHPYRLQCEQHKLVKILFGRAQASLLIEIHLGMEVVSVTQDGDIATATARSEQGEQKFFAPYLIGADGSRSVVRQSLDLPMEGDTYPSDTILITTPFRFEDHMPFLSGANYIWGPKDSGSMFRLRDEWRCTFYPRPGQIEEHVLTDELIQDRLHGLLAWPQPFEVWEQRGYRIHQRIVPNYRVGRSRSKRSSSKRGRTAGAWRSAMSSASLRRSRTCRPSRRTRSACANSCSRRR
jgi:3-(3-hydroxy-phenyl)propionate hydroxylase